MLNGDNRFEEKDISTNHMFELGVTLPVTNEIGKHLLCVIANKMQIFSLKKQHFG